MDLTLWNIWWDFNKDPYLNLKSHVHGVPTMTGDESWFLGRGNKTQSKDSLKPTEEQIRQKVVPALLAALEKETNNDIVTGALIALAKIGDAASETGDSRFEKVISRFLSDKNQEIGETAAVALGILANADSIPTLESLLVDGIEGRKLVGQPEVSYRTRAFAAYGLGLIGARTASEENRRRIVTVLRRTLETDSTKTRDLKVSCVIALGLVPLANLESNASPGKTDAPVPPETSLVAQIEYFISMLQDEGQPILVRAHCPGVLARLLAGLPRGSYEAYRERVAADLIERIHAKKREKNEVVQSAVLALGLIGTNDAGNPLDKRIREALVLAGKDADVQVRNFSMIALAKVGGSVAPDAKNAEGGIEDVAKTLLNQLADGKSNLEPWAGLACGVLVHRLEEANYRSPQIDTLEHAVRTTLLDEKDPSKVGALAIASGIMGDLDAMNLLIERLDEERGEAQGYVAIALGLMDARDAIGRIEKLVDESKYQPERLKQSAIALGLLGDKNVVTTLTELLKESKSLATQASISSALGFIGDRHSIDPLVAMLQNDQLTESARGFAAVALGIVADKELLPWNSRIALDLNYRASTPTLTDPAVGTGILDIL